MPQIKILYLPNAPKQDTEHRESPQRIQLVAAIEEAITLRPRERAIIPTGIAMELPSGWEGQIHSLPSIAMEQGLTVLNSPGTIDPDYRGEVKVILVNLGEREVKVERGMAIARMYFAPFTRVQLIPTDSLDSTDRADGGLGSTGQ